MEPTPRNDDDPSIAEATEWMMLLHEEPDDAGLRRRFEAWRRASPSNEAAWREIDHLSGVATTMEPAHRTIWGPYVARLGSPADRDRSSVRFFNGRRLVPNLVLAAVAAAIIVVAGPWLMLRLLADHMTVTAEERRIDLPDGSRIVLAPSSAMAVDYAGNERRVRLLAGEAYFQVTPDRDRPFRVEAAGVETTVLGTSFDVRIQPDDVLVAVAEGKVRVTSVGRPDHAEDLTAGESVRLSPKGDSLRGKEDVQAIGAWREGQLYAEALPIRDAVSQLRRYFAGTIVISDDALAGRRITGAFNLADPESALRAIAAVQGATVRRISPWLLVLSPS